MKINTISSIPGSGKTEYIIQRLKREFKSTLHHVTFVGCSIQLLEEVFLRLQKEKINEKDITIIHSNNGKETVKRVIEHYNNRPKDDILLITSNTMERISNTVIEEDLFIIDEEVSSTSLNYYKFSEQPSRDLALKIIKGTQVPNHKLLNITLNKKSKLNEEDFVLNQVTKSYLYKSLELPNVDVYSFEKEYTDFINGISDGFPIVTILNLNFLSKCKEVLYLGFDIDNTISSLIYKSDLYDYEFKEINHNLRKSYSCIIQFEYFSEKPVGNTFIKSNPSFVESVNDYLKENVRNICLLRGWNYDSKIPNPEINYMEVPAIPHGINDPEWNQIRDIVCLSNFKLSPYMNKFLSELGYSNEEGNEGRHVNMIIQIMARSALRNNSNGVRIYLLDKETAIKVVNKINPSFYSYKKIELKGFDTNKKEPVSSTDRSRKSYLNRKKKQNTITKNELKELLELELKSR